MCIRDRYSLCFMHSVVQVSSSYKLAVCESKILAELYHVVVLATRAGSAPDKFEGLVWATACNFISTLQDVV